jgi:hypothetical protein
MTHDGHESRGAGTDGGTDDEQQLAELGGALPALDLDTTTAEQIARRTRNSVGKPPSRRRWILPIIAAVVTVSYAAWAILKALEVLG